MALIYYLVVYNRQSAEVVYQEFENADEASSAYARLEAEYGANDEVEVVLLGADSIETIKKTHPNYFVREDLPFASAR